jgi:hypothetical protein
MADQKIDGFYSEYDIRTDKATTSLKSLGKEEQALQKALKGGSKETAARTKATTDRGKAEEKERKAAEKRRKDEEKEEKNKSKAFEKEKKDKEKALSAAKKSASDKISGAAGLAGGAASGSAIGSVAAVLPLGLGALIVGAVAAINRAAGAIETVATGSKERARAGRAASGLDIQGKGFGAGFSAADVRSAKTILGELGVEKLSQREINTLQEGGKIFGSLADAASNIVSGKNLRPFGQEGKNAESILGAIPETSQTAAFKAQTGLELFAALIERQKKRADKQSRESAYSLSITKRADALADKEYSRSTKLAAVEGIDAAINATRDADDFFVRGAAKGAAKTVKELKKVMKNVKLAAGGNLKDAAKNMQLDSMERSGLINAKQREEIEAKEGLSGGETSEGGGGGGDIGGGGGSSGGAAAPTVSGGVNFYISGVTDPMQVYRIVEEKFTTLMNKYAGGEFAAELGLRGGAF